MTAHAQAVLPMSLEDQPAVLPGLKAAHYESRKKEAILNTRVPVALRDRLRARADAAGLTVARYVRAVLEEAVTDQ